uniref:Uncharacterized protein n=1 Tax=Desertifilum tharense IPPAS B-1220 TaxID=1781255 RepID=A0ACD5GU73_9CYAN
MGVRIWGRRMGDGGRRMGEEEIGKFDKYQLSTASRKQATELGTHSALC